MKIKFGALVTDGRGKLGGHVASKNRSGNYLRTKVTPTNPQTFDQQATRAVLGTLSSGWSGLTADQRSSFDAAVADWSSTNIFGDIKNPTGKNLYVSLNKYLLESGQAQISVAPSKTEMPYFGVTASLWDISLAEAGISSVNSPGGFFVNISATAPQSAGTGFYKGKYRKLLTVDSADINTSNFYASYVAKFGAPLAGANISVKVQAVATTGQVNTPEYINATVIA